MASQIIGRTRCPECDFDAAHVKQSEKCLYRYCPECGAQYHAKSPRQAEALRRKMRAVPDAAPAAAPATPTPTPTGATLTGATPTPAAKPAPTPAAPRALFGRGLFGA